MANTAYSASNGTTWKYWVSCDSGTASTANTWTAWTSGTSATSSNSSTWRVWIDGEAQSVKISTYPQPTAEQLEQRRIEAERRQAEWRAQEEARKAEDAKAEATAQELLEHFLTPEQRETMERVSEIAVKSQSEKTYLVKKHGRVQELNEAGQVIAEYCIIPSTHLPPQDAMLIKKLMLETDESAFLKIANRTRIQ